MATVPYPGELKFGLKGDSVKVMQKALSIQETGEFGKTTEEIVKHFQKFHNLDQDGIVGPKTWEAIFPSMNLADVLVRTAVKYIGVKEDPMGTNRGKLVSYWQSLLGLDGQPWCAAFVYGMFQESSASLKVKNPMKPDAYCPTILTWAREKNLIVSTPQAGDVFLLKDPDYGAKHIGIVLKNNGDGTFQTVEGNAGDQVKSLTRSNGSCIFFRLTSQAATSTVNVNSTSTGNDKTT